MALFNVNNWSAEDLTSQYCYEQMILGVQHINGKGCTDRYTPSNDVKRVMKVDVMRILPAVPAMRKIGASNNGGYFNSYNSGNTNAPQSTFFQIDIDMIYDRKTPVPFALLTANKTSFEAVLKEQIIQAMTWAINSVTYAKQIEAFFRNGDNFDTALAHTKGSVVSSDITAAEMSKALFTFDTDVSGSRSKAFTKANAVLTGGIPQIGAFAVPINERQAFVTDDYYNELMSQYATNASEAAAQINATGYMNPFTQSEQARIDTEKTGLLGLYNGVYMFRLDVSVREFAYMYLGLTGSAAAVTTCKTALNKIEGFICYGGATLRGFAYAPTIEVRPNNDEAQSYNILPLLKMGVTVLHGASIKVIVNGGSGAASGITASDIATLINTLTFTGIQDDGAAARTALPNYQFNDGTTL